MCVAAGAGIGLLFSALSSVASYVGQSQAAKQQERYEQQKFEAREKERLENAENANAAFVRKSADQNLRSLQEQEAAAIEKEKVQTDKLKVEGEALASSQSSGISLGAILGDLAGQQGKFNNSIETQLAANVGQNTSEIDGYRAEAIDRMNSIRPYIPQPVNRPSPLALVANIGGSFVKAGGNFKYS